MAPKAQPQSAPQPSVGATFQLAWPLAINLMMLQVVIILDTYLVSLLGETSLAAMGLASAVATLLLGALSAISHATQILVARAKGSANTVGLKSTFWCAIFIGLAVASLGVSLVWLFAEGIIRPLAHSAHIADQALQYLYYFCWVVIFEAVSQSITCYFNGTGRTKLPFYSHILQAPINIGLSIVLIFGLMGMPEMGLSGAAIGSAVAALIRMLFLAACVYRFDKAQIETPGWEHTTPLNSTKQHLIFALPIAAAFFGHAASNTVCTFLYAQMSINDFAAMTLIMPWVQAAGMLMIAWAQSTGIFVGQLLGQQVPNATLNSFLFQSWRAAIATAGLVALIYLSASLAFGWIYRDLNPVTLAALWSFLPALLIMPFLKISNSMCVQTIRAGGDSVSVMNIHLASQWAYRVPLTALLVLYLNWSVTWVFTLLLIEEVLKFPFFHLRLYHGKWRTMLAQSNTTSR